MAAREMDWEAYDEAVRTIRCGCGTCHPQSLHDCTCGYAANTRNQIRDLVAGDPLRGQPPRTAQEVIDLYVQEFGAQIRIAPEAKGFNLLAWLGPLVGLVLAVAGLGVLLQRWTQAPRLAQAVVPAAASTPDEDDPYLQRVRKSLEELDV